MGFVNYKIAHFTLRKLYGEEGPVNDETLGEASQLIPASSVFGGSVEGVIALEALSAFLRSQGLSPKGAPGFGAESAGIKRGKGYKSTSAKTISCDFIQYHTLVKNGAVFKYKKCDDNSYRERWIQLSEDG